MTDTIELTATPVLAKVFAGAVASARGRSGRGGLPALTVRQTGVSVDVAALADYDHACGFTLRDQLPVTYLHNLVFPLQATLFADKRYPYPLVGSVHLSNRLTQHRPVTLAEELTLETSAHNARPHRSGVQVDVVSRALVGQELVWEGLAVYLYRGQKIDGATPERVERPAAGADGPGAIWRLPADLGRRFARVSGDVNPIHLSGLSARALGFPRAIAHGMWSQAAMVAAIESRLPSAYVVDTEFRKPVTIPGTVEFLAHPGPQDDSWQLALRRARAGAVLVQGSVRRLGPSISGSAGD